MKRVDELVASLHKKKVEYYWSLFGDWLNEGGKILDVGCGSGELDEFLVNKGYRISCVDVVDKSRSKLIRPVVFNGRNLPFEDKSFDQILILAVLHHVVNYQEVILEAKRVAREVIILDDLVENWWQRLEVGFWDSVLNLEFLGHPHHNHSDREWQKLFNDLGFKLIDRRYGQLRELFYAFRQGVYRLKS